MSRSRQHKPDVILILLMSVLLTVGLVVIYSISPILSHELLRDADRNYFMYGQLRHIGLGLIAFVVASQLPVQLWRKIMPYMAALTLLALVLMFIPQLGISEGGATRWLDLGVVSIQPAELVKLTAVIMAATWFAGLKPGEISNYKYALLPVFGFLGVAGLFIMIHQKDLGTMVVVAAIVTAIFFAAGARWRQLAVLFGAGGGAVFLSIIFFPHRLERLKTFFQPTQGLAESGYHLHQALIAIGSGGLFGVGLGRSVQVYGYLPEAANDSIFAIIGETFGLVGALVVLILFGLLVYRCLNIAQRTEEAFARYVVLGITTWIGVQAGINIMAMLGIIPLTGITLPLLSYGGTSLVFVMLGLGIVVNISRYTIKESHANRSQRRRQRRPHNTDYSHRPSSAITW